MKNILPIKQILAVLLLVLLLIYCNRKETKEVYQPVFSKAVLGDKTLVWGFPSYSYCENAELIVKYLNKRLTGAHIVVKSCVNWDEYVSYLNQNAFDITLVNGLEAINVSNHGYTIFGKIMDDSQYTGIVFARKDAGVNKIADLKGRTIALVQSKVILGSMMPLYYLYEQGLNVNDDIKKIEVSSFESAIVSTYLGKSEAGLSLKRNWDVYVRDHPEVLSKVELKWETQPLVNNALLIKMKTDKNITRQLMNLLFQMHGNQEGKTALKQLEISGFEKANKGTYKSIQEFKKKYDAVIY